MHFLNPQAFWAFLLLIIPILIHLFNFRRVRKIYFSNLAFLSNIKQERKSRSNLKRILILATRMLALTALVLAFSRPVFVREQELSPSQSLAIYVDNSMSMQQTDLAGNTLLTNALMGVESLLRNFPATQVAFITNDQKMIRWEPSERVLEQLAEVGFSKRTTTLGAVNEKINPLNPDEFKVFSDFQRSVSQLDPILSDTTKKISLYYQHSPVDGNLYIDSVYLDKPPGISGGNKLHIAIRNTGTEKKDDVLIKLFRSDRQLSSFSIAIEGKSVEVVTVEIGVNDEIGGNYRVEIEDSPIVFDNNYFFTINQNKKPLVMILYKGRPNAYLKNVFSNSEHFALIQNSIDNISFQEVVKSDLLVLDHLNDFPQWLVSQLNDLPGNVLVVPGVSVNISNYASVLGFPITEHSSQETAISAVALATNPFFEGIFLKKNDRMSLPQVRVKYRPTGFHHTLLTTNAGNPFLARSGERNTYFITTPLADSVTNFHKHALFVPVMYKLVQSAVTPRLAYRLDESYIAIASDSLTGQSTLKLARTNDSYIISARIQGNDAVLQLPEVLEDPGIYQLISGNDTLQSIALNYNKLESEIETIPADEVRKRLSGYDHVKLYEITDVQEFIKKNNRDEAGDSLWKYALLLALIFIVSELLLLRFI